MSQHGPLPATALEEALALAGMGCWHWPHGSVTPLLSASFSALLGYPREALPQTPGQWLNLAHPDERRPFADLLEELGQAAPDRPPFHLRLRHGSGLWRWFEVRVAPSALDGDGGASVVTFTDITRHKQTEAGLQRIEKSEKTYRALVETSPDAILLLGLDGAVHMANQQAARLFGLDDLGDLGTTRVQALFAAADDADFLRQPDDFSGFIATRQLAMQSIDGSPFTAATAYTTVMDAQGEASGIVLFVRDVTDHLKAERELERHRQNLERLVEERTFELGEAHATLAKIIDASPVPTLVLDAGHRITHWNAACEQIIGMPASQMVGTRDQWKAFYPNQRPIMADLVITGEMTRIQELYSNKYRRSKLVHGGYEAEDYFPMFDRWLFFTAAPLHDKQGRIVGAIETLQDITERKQAEVALTDAKHAAEAAAETKATFLANMSHEIRTPMNAVIGLAHLLLKGDLSGKQRDYISRIHGAAKMLLGVINDVLDFSKIEAGQMKLEETEFTLDEVLDNVSSVLLHRAQEKGLELQYVVEPGVPAQLLGDPLHLAQILVNLIGNALKFTASGSVSVYVRRLAADSDACVRLEFDVQDTGIGMSAEQQRNLFQAFSQADTSITRKFGGTGLGLAISKHLTELMGGDIWVSSQPRVGSTFSFTVNLRPGRQPAAVVHAASHRPPVVDDNLLAGLRVLLVDDLPTNCLIAGEILEAFGATVDTAENGVQALRKLLDDQIPCDVVLMDIQMPEMDGLEATRRLRATLRGARLPIIAMTAHALDSERERCRAAGMDDFIAKPIDPEFLQQKLLRWRPAHAGKRASRTPEKTCMSSSCELPELPGIDKADGLRRMMNKPALYEKVLRDFHSRFLGETEAIRAAIDSGDLATAERRAHSSKGLAGTIGASALQQAAKALETALRERDAGLEAFFARFADELRQVIDGIARGFGIGEQGPR